MAFKEKIAWLTLVSMLVAYGVYFPLVATRHYEPLEMIWLFGTVTIIQAIVVIVVSATMAIRSTKEARAPADERDRAIARRGTAYGYYVMMVGVILVGVVIPHMKVEPAVIVNTSLLAIVVAEAVRLSIVVFSYRRGWHG